MNGTIEATIRVDNIIDQIDTDTLIEEINDRGGVAAEDWGGLFREDFTLITDILDAIRDESETEEIISWLKREGYRVTNADDDVIVIKRRKLELVVDYHIVTAVSQMTEQAEAMKDVFLATALKSSGVAINDIIAELTGANKKGEE
jgi:hypothetical protein